MNTERMLTVDELARRLAVGAERVRELARTGAIPSMRVGKTLRFDWAEVRDALRAQAVAGAAPQERAS